MTTYTTPHFANGASDRNLRTEPSINRARPAPTAPYRTAGVTNEAAVLADGRTPDWQPGMAKGGVPKAAVGALGAALVGGVALAIVLMAPSNKVVKHAQPDPIAQASAQNQATQKSVDATTAAVNEMENNAPAAGSTVPAANGDVAADSKTTTSTTTTQVDRTSPALPAPVKAVIPRAAPVVHEHHVKATVAAPKAAPQPQQSVAPTVTPTVAPDVPAAPAVTPEAPAPAPDAAPPADVQAPAMQQTPDAPTVAPEPTPSPTPDTPSPTPSPAPTE